MERRRTLGSSSHAAALALVLVLAACAASGPATPPPSVDLAPWEAPVVGAAAATEWEDQGQPTSPFGPGAYPWTSPAELIAAMARSLDGQPGVRATGRVVHRNTSGTVIGWVRMEIVEPADGTIAADLRIDMRNDGGTSWYVARVLSRDHCDAPLRNGSCP